MVGMLVHGGVAHPHRPELAAHVIALLENRDVEPRLEEIQRRRHPRDAGSGNDHCSVVSAR